MKKLFLLSAALMALATTACKDEPMLEAESAQETPAIGDIDGKYIAVRIANSDASRALTAEDLSYEVGTTDENKIAEGELHFLFFDMDGNPFMMKGNITGEIKDENGTVSTNWVKPINIDAGTADNNGAPGGSNSVLVLGKVDDNGAEHSFKGSMPSRMVCIANVNDDDIKANYANKTIAQLLDYNTKIGQSSAPIHTSLYNNKGNFVMTSATYWDGADIICWSEIEASNICAKPKLASENPVEIYIERLAAKVNVGGFPGDPRVKNTTGDNFVFDYWYVDPADNQVRQATNKVIFMKPVGWALNNTCKQVFGIKHLLSENGTSPYFENVEDFNHNGRSFWATTSSRHVFDKFIPVEVDKTLGTTAYLMPNTRDPFLKGNNTGVTTVRTKPNFARSYATKILLATQLYIEEETATEITHDTPDQLMLWSGNYYTPEALCRVLERNNPGKRVVYARTQDPDDIEGHYKVKFYTLSDGSLTYPDRDIVDPLTGLIPDDMNIDGLEDDIPSAQFWNGMSYYIINICNNIPCTKVGSPDKGKVMFGVVRNTAYYYDFERYVGMGTPIPTPEAPTEVENPTESDSYVSAKLNILNWRVVSNSNVTLQ